MLQEVLDEIYELEEVIVSLSHFEDSNAEVVGELRLQIERLKEILNQPREELYNDKRPLFVGGEVSSKDDC